MPFGCIFKQQNYEDNIFSENSPSNSVMGLMTPESVMFTLDSKVPYPKLARPFLHPTVSRLRSYTPQSSRLASNGSSATSHSHLFDGVSPSPSHFSSMSRVSSISDFKIQSSEKQGGTEADKPMPDHNVFKWQDLQMITQTMYSKASQKVSNMLGAPLLGSPTVLAPNGLICIGTTEGKVVVHDFKQTLLCVCENQTLGS